MEKSEVTAGIKSIMEDALKGTANIKELSENMNLLEEIHLDSIQAMEILLQVEEKFDIMIDDEDLNKALFSSLSAMSDYVMKKL